MRVGNRYGLQNLGVNIRPIVLRTVATVRSGEQTAPDDTALRNPTGEPIEAHEFKFYVRGVQTNGAARASGGLMSASIWVDDKPITDGFVPIWNLSPAYALDIERLVPGWAAPVGGNGTRFLGQVAVREDGMYYWKLDHPLFIGKSSGLRVAFKHSGLDSLPVISGLSVSARVLPNTAKPSKIRVPWVSSWSSAMYEALSAGEETSPSTALTNPFSQPLQVERFIGRINQLAQFVGTGLDGVSQQSLVADMFNGIFERTFLVKHYDSAGGLICPAQAKFRNVYGYRTRSWTTKFKMGPNTYHRIELTKEAPPAGVVYSTEGTSDSRFIQATAQAQVSLVGWREESI